MDIRKLQRVIVDGLEDVKAQNILVFNTEHLSSLFERVIIASGTSNRQTKSLASSVRESVKSAGFPVPRTEGETNGEWIIVDCGAAVVHVMQPVIREYYHLEEIWGGKPVKVKLEDARVSLVKASEPEAPAAKKRTARSAAKPPAKPPAKPAATEATMRAPAKKGGTKAVPAKKVAAKAPVKSAGKVLAKSATKPAAKPAAKSAVKPPMKTPAKKAPAKKAAAPRMVTRVVGIKKAPAKKAAASKAPVRRAISPAAKQAVKRPPGRK